MKKILKIIAIVLFIFIIAIQFFRPDRINLPVVEAETLQASTEVPEDVQNILQTSCNDCHTNQTNWIWYSNIAPVSWKMVEHVEDGRRELNFSIWNTYDTKRKTRKLEEICEMVESREMPLPSYLWLHWNARLHDEQVKILCDWTAKEIERLAGNP
ncbi:MAG TPA: heme-binding domain-containing protein [Pyrinomonadaceae bacterium]|nr:heme-binding domain-containing protein [Pyrinomonadaceae bacterium]